MHSVITDGIKWIKHIHTKRSKSTDTLLIQVLTKGGKYKVYAVPTPTLIFQQF